VRLGVVLVQLGGPDSIEAVEPFLYNLFRDPDIIDFPFARIARQPLARLIAAQRAKHVAAHYREIGGRSPIIDFTMAQASALERLLRRDFDARVTVAMRYWHPMTDAAVRAIERHSPDELVLLPLYPQYSRTTTGSSLREWNRCFQNRNGHARVHVVKEFHEDPGYIDSAVAKVNDALAGFADAADTDFVFSAHGLPVAVVEQGDPYQRQIERTAELVWERGGWSGRRHVCYQSKVGASKWLAPSLHRTIAMLAEERRQNLLIVPISFVSDHVETLHEIDIEHREQALSLGVANFRMVAGLNDSPAFIEALAELVRARIAS
jgi:protoporphyrin/coproporphyrin ferrochelatase